MVPPRPPEPPEAPEAPVPPEVPSFSFHSHRGPAGGPRKLGIRFQEISGQLAQYFHLSSEEGILVVHVDTDSPAAKAGIKAGDVVLKIDGKSVADEEDLRRAVDGLEAGKEASLTVQRDGKASGPQGDRRRHEARAARDHLAGSQRSPSGYAGAPAYPEEDRMRRRPASLAAALLFLTAATLAQAQVWPREKAETWYAAQPWLVGCNYIPATAINQLEMWQADTFDRQADRPRAGLGRGPRLQHHARLPPRPALGAGRRGIPQRIDQFLAIAQKHQIGVMFVLFDSCWDPFPALGQAARAATGRPQLGLGAEPRAQGARRSRRARASSRLTCTGVVGLRRPTTASTRGTSGTSPTT